MLPAWHPSYSANATPSRVIHWRAGYKCDIGEVIPGRIFLQRSYLKDVKLDS